MARLVYSSEDGNLCPDCRRAPTECTCNAADPAPPGDGTVRVARETRGRRGKAVTLISGVPLAGAKLTQLGKRLKKTCGSGGTVRDGVIEIQGDHRDRLVTELARQGWKVKRSGG